MLWINSRISRATLRRREFHRPMYLPSNSQKDSLHRSRQTAVYLICRSIETGMGELQAVVEMIDKAPPGPIATKWGVGFRSYSECLEYIRANNIKVPEGGVAL